jgi:hypothetical protein
MLQHPRRPLVGQVPDTTPPFVVHSIFAMSAREGGWFSTTVHPKALAM